MAGTASDPFFWNDWQGDPCLRACTLAAQGLWMRMLCLAAEAPKKGYVMIGSRFATHEDIARQAAISLETAEGLLKELEDNDVFSRDRNGNIYNRRMIRVAKSRQASAKGGKKGGRISADNKTGIHATPVVTPDIATAQTPPPKELPSPLPSPSPSPEERTTSLRSVGRRAKLPSTALPADCPSEEDQEEAREYWLKRGRGDLVSRLPDEILAFRDNHESKGSRMVDWSAAWRTWRGNALKFNRKPNGNGSQKLPTAHDSFLAGVGELISEIRGEGGG